MKMTNSELFDLIKETEELGKISIKSKNTTESFGEVLAYFLQSKKSLHVSDWAAIIKAFVNILNVQNNSQVNEKKLIYEFLILLASTYLELCDEQVMEKYNISSVSIEKISSTSFFYKIGLLAEIDLHLLTKSKYDTDVIRIELVAQSDQQQWFDISFNALIKLWRITQVSVDEFGAKLKSVFDTLEKLKN